MATKAYNLKFTGTTTPISSYDSTKTNLGTLIKQYTGATNEDKYVGPIRLAYARPFEQSTSIPGAYPHVIQWSSTIDWVFLADNAAAATTRRIVLYEFNRTTSVYTWKGFITLTYPTATLHTIRGLRVTLDDYTTGTVAVSGTAVTGTSTTWSADRICVGSRIGFGSTDPTQISTWYEISAVGSDTSITLTSSAGTISAGTAYVIEDLRILTSTTNATTTNGGFFVAKGIKYELFISTGTTIPAATTIDSIRAVYWLADAATVTNTIACGVAIDDKTSWTSQLAYIIDQTGPKVYVYNFRAALTLTAGKDTTTNTIKTGNQAVTGTITQVNNGRVGTLNHGPGSGIKSLYFVTTTRVYRAALTNLITNSTTWQSDVMVEIPPGSTNTLTATSLLNSLEISTGIDSLIIFTTGAAGVRNYVTKFNTTSTPFNHIFMIDSKQLDSTVVDSDSFPHPTINALPFTGWSEGGLLHLVRVSAANTNVLYNIPIGADWDYESSTNECVITPSIDISDSTKLYNVYVSNAQSLGLNEFQIPTEQFRIYYRTSGISGNTGSWTLLDKSGDLSSASGTAIQFKITFRTIGSYCIPSRIYGLTVVYEDTTTDTHYEPSVSNSSISSRIFAYRQKLSWGSNIPNMRIRLYNASTNVIIIDDDVNTSVFGTFEYSSNNGISWNAWDNTQDTVGNYIRYTASSLPSGVRVRALLSQA